MNAPEIKIGDIYKISNRDTKIFAKFLEGTIFKVKRIYTDCFGNKFIHTEIISIPQRVEHIATILGVISYSTVIYGCEKCMEVQLDIL